MKRALLAAILLGLAFWKPSLGSEWFQRLESWLDNLARRPGRAVLLVGLASFCLSATITALLGVSPPHIHDEFANLLAADTFAHGKLSNPPHPFWIHFEGIHILSQPAYISKYPPAQGLFLALGQVLASQPIVGMWLSAALACAATCWMLQAWVPARWALLGGLLAVVHPQILKWSQVYWGGSEAWLGGAFLLGGFRRVMEKPDWRAATWMGIGMAFLAISRPYEGFVLSLIVMLSLVMWMLRMTSLPFAVTVPQVLLPIVGVMLLLVGALGFYNVRTTANVLRMPYMLYEEQYAVAPFMVWQKPRSEPAYHHPLIRDHMIKYALMEYERQQTPAGLARETWQKFCSVAQGFFWDFNPRWLWLAVLMIPLGALIAALRGNHLLKFAAGVLVLFSLALSLETWMWPRYAAPIASLLLLFVVCALRQLTEWQPWQRPVGRFIARMLIALCLLSVLPWCLIRAHEYALKDWDYQRVQMIRQLQQEGGRHLVIVRYGPRQSVHDDWVHNDADIDASTVAWARDMGEVENRKLIDYFKDRKVWLLEVEFTPDREETGKIPVAKLVPYPGR